MDGGMGRYNTHKVVWGLLLSPMLLMNRESRLCSDVSFPVKDSVDYEIRRYYDDSLYHLQCTRSTDRCIELF